MLQAFFHVSLATASAVVWGVRGDRVWMLAGITRVLDKHIHPAHTFYDIMLQYALHNEYA